ncbi:MAG: cytochrome c [Alphaproteobacteria bacterium]|nr:cytochrome c [Alphaproteobacteria bacterium]
MKPVLLATLGIVAAGAVATSAFADGHIEKAVKARQGFMQVVSFNLGPLGAMAKGEMDYDAELAANNAKNLHALSTMNNGAMWPQGSDNATLGEDKTRALPAAWAADSKVGEKHQAWIDASAQLAEVAGNGLDALKPAVAGVGKSCGGCHDDYRAEKK